MKYKNFYETVAEAVIRLNKTVIWYDGPGEQGPYYVLGIAEGQDGKFKIYMKRIGQKYITDPSVLPPSETVNQNDPSMGKYLDDFMKKYPKFGILRKDLDSPHFKAFRPFPLGMMNSVVRDKSGKPVDCECLYLERQPNRTTQQGLIKGMVYISEVNAAMSRAPKPASYGFDLWSEDFYNTCMGVYPNIDTCLSKLRDPLCSNEAVAFSRYFALVRGPIDILFLSYKDEIVGLLDNRNLSSVTVSREHRYAAEAISDLNVFKNIQRR